MIGNVEQAESKKKGRKKAKAKSDASAAPAPAPQKTSAQESKEHLERLKHMASMIALEPPASFVRAGDPDAAEARPGLPCFNDSMCQMFLVHGVFPREGCDPLVHVLGLEEDAAPFYANFDELWVPNRGRLLDQGLDGVPPKNIPMPTVEEKVPAQPNKFYLGHRVRDGSQKQAGQIVMISRSGHTVVYRNEEGELFGQNIKCLESKDKKHDARHLFELSRSGDLEVHLQGRAKLRQYFAEVEDDAAEAISMGWRGLTTEVSQKDFQKIIYGLDIAGQALRGVVAQMWYWHCDPCENGDRPVYTGEIKRGAAVEIPEVLPRPESRLSPTPDPVGVWVGRPNGVKMFFPVGAEVTCDTLDDSSERAKILGVSENGAMVDFGGDIGRRLLPFYALGLYPENTQEADSATTWWITPAPSPTKRNACRAVPCNPWHDFAWQVEWILAQVANLDDSWMDGREKELLKDVKDGLGETSCDLGNIGHKFSHQLATKSL